MVTRFTIAAKSSAEGGALKLDGLSRPERVRLQRLNLKATRLR